MQWIALTFGVCVVLGQYDYYDVQRPRFPPRKHPATAAQALAAMPTPMGADPAVLVAGAELSPGNDGGASGAATAAFSWSRRLRSSLVALLGCALTIGGWYGSWALFETTRDAEGARWVPFTLGSIVSSVLIGAGFVPQLALILRSRSSAGFSVGLSLFDLSSSVAAVVAISLDKASVGALLPFAVIVLLQLLLLFLCLCVYPDPSRRCCSAGGDGGSGKQQRTQRTHPDPAGLAAAAGAVALSEQASSNGRRDDSGNGEAGGPGRSNGDAVALAVSPAADALTVPI